MRTLIKNIKQIVQYESTPRPKVCGSAMSHIGTMDNAFLVIDDGRIAAVGPMETLAAQPLGTFDSEVDATGRLVFPAFCDSHTHMVYAGSLEIEYIEAAASSTRLAACRRPTKRSCTTKPCNASRPWLPTAPEPLR